MRAALLLLSIAFAGGFGAAVAEGAAQPKPTKNAPVYFTADTITYGKADGVVVATGKVQAVQGDYICFADKMTYNQEADQVIAEGQVSLLQPDGSVIFSNHMVLHDDLKQGVIDNFKARMKDDSRIVANSAVKTGPDHYTLDKAVYSPCKLCRDATTGEAGPPLWQIKARDVEVDEAAQEVIYHNAFMEVYGVPILYTPYFDHPTPNADRKTGMLTPEYSQSSQLGTTIQVPVYINIAPDKDATLTPFLTTKLGEVLIGQYRQKTDTGYFQADGSIAQSTEKAEDDGSKTRGHLFVHGGTQLDDKWDWGFDINRATDDTYLRLYRLGDQDTLTSRLFLERLDDRNYFNIEGLAFQGLRSGDDQKTTPLVLPQVTDHLETDPLKWGSRFTLDTSARSITRSEGADSQRATLQAGYKLPYVTDDGQLFEAKAMLRQDVYNVNDYVMPNGRSEDGVIGRTVPTLSFDWKEPLIQYFGNSNLVIEPQIELILSSNGNNSQKIPDEDSQVAEFSDINLFSTDRDPGYDRIEDGSRAVYGVTTQYKIASGEKFIGELGQDFQLTGNRDFPVTEDSVSDDVSDYVGRVGVLAPKYELDYRFRVDAKDYQLDRDEVHGGFTLDPVALYADYIRIEDDPLIVDRQQVGLSSSIKFNKDWSLNAYGKRDIDDDRMISAGGGLTFANECITIVTRLDREYVQDRDVQPSTSVSFRVFFKNLN